MATSIRELFPFGDLDADVPHRMAERFAGLPADEIAAALGLGNAVLSMMEILTVPLEEAGLTPARWRLLIALAGQAGPEGETIGRLAGRLGVREPTMTATVDRAEREGLVRRRRDPSDGRVVLVSLTEVGARTMAKMVPVVAARLAAFVSALGGPDAAAELTRRLSAAVEAAEAVPVPRS